ncbi:hypothetical protein JD844_005407 [Phrynosoma platyrhinos]|uniref:Uncharacterized protein n=1 Tax=Phrynosoma platyrhinos TaxID=52577 RepID=A0ABQ7TN14_PHRPL|nr:hypothetical protein JD844_005407 [Phrynosoma platyrhinos]
MEITPHLHVKSARSLSYSEPDLWRNGFLRKFGGLAWRKQRNSHLQIPTSGPWPLGRLQRPAVGSDVDMRGRSHSGPTLDDIRKQERPRPTSQPSDIDSIGTSPVPSISLDSLLCCGDGSSWEGSFSLSNPSLSCSIAPEMKGEVLKLPSVLEESNKAPRLLSEWVESALSGYLSSRFSHITVMEEPENLSFSSGLGESIPEQVSGVEEPKIAPPSPPMEEPLMIVETPQTSLGKKGSKIRYEIRITLTKKEDKENGMAEVGPIAGCGQRALPSHPSGEGTLSLGVAELEETEEQRHPKLAQPAPQVSARKEFQNCTGLHRVGTCKLCRRILTPDTVNPEATATAALRWESETRQGEGKDPSQTDELQLGDGPPEEGTDVIAPDPLADRYVGEQVWGAWRHDRCATLANSGLPRIA